MLRYPTAFCRGAAKILLSSVRTAETILPTTVYMKECSCYIPYFNLVVDGFEHSRKIKAVKKSLCNQNGITYCEINSKDPFAMAAQIKALFRKNHVYITSENENDIRFCRNLFFSVKRKNARTS